MARIPAICQNCGLVFPSWLAALPNTISHDNLTQCPRCQAAAPVLNGYVAIIDGMVAFIASPLHTHTQKLMLIHTAVAVSQSQLSHSEASNRLDARNPEAGRLFREWATLGFGFLGMIAAVASTCLQFYESRANAPLDEMAMQSFDEVMVSTPQVNLAPTVSIIPPERPLKFQTQPDADHGGGAASKLQNGNRHARRARAKKDRSR
jgi:hypothetical protein